MLTLVQVVGSRWRQVSLLMMAGALSACAAVGANRDGDRGYVYRSDGDYVRVAPIESGASANSHPFAVSVAQLRRLLADVKVKGASSVGPKPVFSNEELDRIAQPLAVALSKADSTQDVTFAVTGYRGLLGKYSPKSATTGRLFARADSLNLIFGLVQQRMDSGDLDYSAYTPSIVPGLRARRVGSTVWKLVPGAAHFHGKRGDWLVFERSAFSAPTVLPPTKAEPGSGTETSAPGLDRKAQEIENRLRTLEDLRKRGAITEQEYQQRRREILQEL